MLSVRTLIENLDAACRNAIAAVAEQRLLAVAVLLLLGTLCYLPGLMRVPPVDRTEVYVAQDSQQMADEDTVIAPTNESNIGAMKPIGIYWAQIGMVELATEIAGPWVRTAIATYRLPSLIGSLLAIGLMFWLLSPLIGRPAAFIATALYAVSPIVALQAQLAVSEAAFQPFVIVAQLALLRIYAAQENASTRTLPLAFWSAQGLSFVFNALALPMISLTTIAALAAFDRKIGWLRRLEAAWGLPLMLLLAAPWFIQMRTNGTGPFDGFSIGELMSLLGGAQQQEWRALPGSFTLALIFGALPATLLLVPMVRDLFREQTSGGIARFIAAWVIGYLLYLELLSNKPALYTAQIMFPPVMAAAGMLLARPNETHAANLSVPLFLVVATALIGCIAVPGVAIGLHYITASRMYADEVAIIAAFVIACISAALAIRWGLAGAWFALSTASFALFHVLIFGLVMPRLDTAWPSAHVGPAVAELRKCAPGPVSIVGYREPSLQFVIGPSASLDDADTLAGRIERKETGIALVAEGSRDLVAKSLDHAGVKAPAGLGCIEAIDLMLGCRIVFTAYATGRTERACSLPQRYACRAPLTTPFKACKAPKSDPVLAGPKK